jgi:tetratricopeptide (TPR) repeat protein
MNTTSLRARLGQVACVSLVVAGCASPDGGNLISSLWNRARPSSSRSAELAKSAREMDVRDPAALHLAYGRWREQVGDLDDARVSYESVLREDSGNVDALIGLARIDHLAGRNDQAERRLNVALRESPGNAQVLAAQGQFYAAQNRWTEAIDKLNEAVLAAPTTAEYRYQLAVALARSGDSDAALPHFARTVGMAEAHYNVGFILHEQGRLREAERHLVAALDQRPDLHVAQAMLDEMRTSRSPLTAPHVMAAAATRPEPPPWAQPEPVVSQTAMAAESRGRFAAPAAAPRVNPPAASRSPFADNPFAAAPGTAEVARSSGPGTVPATSWYPTTGRGQDGLTAAQREQMLNQRLAHGLDFADGPVRR